MYLKTLLGVSDIKSLVLKDRLQFIKDLLKVYLIKHPFQNITSFGQYVPSKRFTPGLREILDAHFTGGGGLCGHKSMFLKFQLESLGFDVTPIGGNFARNKIPLSHNLISIKIPKAECKSHPRENRTYLVDVGCGVPLHEPICLEELPFRRRAGGLDYRYERSDENTVLRVNECGDAIVGQRDKSFLSPTDCKITLQYHNFLTHRSAIDAVYLNPRSVFLHQGIYCFRYLDIGEDDFEIVCICGLDLIFITKETRKTQSFQSYFEMLPIILKYFPMISPYEVEATVKNFSIPFEEALKL